MVEPGDPDSSSTGDVERSDVGARFVGRPALVVLVFVLIIGSAVTLLQLWIFWPTALEAPKAASGNLAAGELPPTKVVNYLGITKFTLSTEILFFIVVALSGALGGLIHATRSMALYVGTRTLRWSWIAYYMLLPLIGALGGTLFYVVLRAGLFSPSSEVSQASPFGFAAVAALVGLFSQQALEKLRELAGQIFTPVTPSQDHFE
ncbi:MAG: hypothetical protein V7607_2570 [Solirubrobacteraceae bacterium]